MTTAAIVAAATDPGSMTFPIAIHHLPAGWIKVRGGMTAIDVLDIHRVESTVSGTSITTKGGLTYTLERTDVNTVLEAITAAKERAGIVDRVDAAA